MAVSLNDAWNDSALTSTVETVPKITSKKVVTRLEDDDEDTYVSAHAKQEDKQHESIMYYEFMIAELQNLRKEESKRCTIYIALASIIFAIVFMYIDRLQTKLNNLSQNIHRFHVPQLESKLQIPTQLPWYS